MTIDSEKCFDRIEHSAIEGALCYFGFGGRFIDWVKILLNQFQLCTQNNGFISDWFEATRGCKQGCNLAPLLFLVCGELLAHKIKDED